MSRFIRRSLPVALLLVAGKAAAIDFITLDFQGDMSDIERQTFVDAAAYWNSVITGFKAPYFYENDGVTVATAPPTLTITASLPAIDDIGGTLGQAGPMTARYADNDNLTPHPTYSRYYVSTGFMEFDVADVAAMISANTFYGVVLHEMGHVLGIGTMWDFNTTSEGIVGNPIYRAADPSVTDNDQPVGAYTGQYALAKWIAEFDRTGATFVPVEKGGGAGTANGHWNEFDGGGIGIGPVSNLTGLDLSQELMTGWASDVFFVSEMTLGSLEDLGFEVDYSKAGIVDHVVVVPEPIAWIPAGLAGVLLTAGLKRRQNARYRPRFR